MEYSSFSKCASSFDATNLRKIEKIIVGQKKKQKKKNKNKHSASIWTFFPGLDLEKKNMYMIVFNNPPHLLIVRDKKSISTLPIQWYGMNIARNPPIELAKCMQHATIKRREVKMRNQQEARKF
jgi:hypothetical protein